MTIAPERAEVERFREAIAERLGLEFEDGKLSYLGDLLSERARETASHDIVRYLSGFAAQSTARVELRVLAEQLTVGETYFFRNPDNLRAFAEVVVPDRLKNVARPRLRILSAGCSSGEEAYSLAMVLLERWPKVAAGGVELVGIDINPTVLERARSGAYTSWSLRETPAHTRSRYFREQGGKIVLDPEVRAMVSFEERNLLEDDDSFFYPGAFDVVFCRNVTIYFSQETTRRVIARLTRALAEGGYLFLGHSETLRGISNAFHLLHTHETFYYQLRHSRESVPPPLSPIPERPAPITDGEAWVDVIGRAADRIALLAQRPLAPPASAREPPRAPPDAPLAPSGNGSAGGGWDFGLALSLLQQERFAEALAHLAHLPPDANHDPDAQLLRAVVLVNCGRLAEAEHVCGELLSFDELNAGAHYVMALCRENDGDRAGAVQHDETAIYLAPHFAMPHLHLGLLAKRASDRETARRELGIAIGLLAREDLSRILLFGGGFNRESLTKLCQAELAACGAQP